MALPILDGTMTQLLAADIEAVSKAASGYAAALEVQMLTFIEKWLPHCETEAAKLQLMNIAEERYGSLAYVDRIIELAMSEKKTDNQEFKFGLQLNAVVVGLQKTVGIETYIRGIQTLQYRLVFHTGKIDRAQLIQGMSTESLRALIQELQGVIPQVPE